MQLGALNSEIASKIGYLIRHIPKFCPLSIFSNQFLYLRLLLIEKTRNYIFRGNEYFEKKLSKSLKTMIHTRDMVKQRKKL